MPGVRGQLASRRSRGAEALCMCHAASNSTVFQDILAPFSQRLAQKNASPNRAAVAGCQVLSNVPTLSASKSAAAAATPPTSAVPPV